MKSTRHQPAAPGQPVGRSGLCPCCERYVGPVRICPYCTEGTGEDHSVAILRIASLVLALAGLACLYLAAAARELPAVSIGEITPLMNFARVRVAGTVTKDPYVAREDGQVDYLSFPLTDGTGRIRIAARGEIARTLVNRGLLPGSGAGVDVTGNVRTTAPGEVRLYIQAADHLLLRPPDS